MQSRTTSAYESIMTRFCNLLKENCPDLEEIMYVADDEDAQVNAAITCLGSTFAVKSRTCWFHFNDCCVRWFQKNGKAYYYKKNSNRYQDW